jgi:hypothetical protein
MRVGIDVQDVRQGIFWMMLADVKSAKFCTAISVKELKGMKLTGLMGVCARFVKKAII